MRRRLLLRPISLAVFVLIAGLSIIGCYAMRQSVNGDERKILLERGATTTDAMASMFGQEISSIRVLAEAADGAPGHAQRVVAAGAKPILSDGVTALGIARPARDGSYVLTAAAGDGLQPGSRITGPAAQVLARGADSFGGATAVLHTSSRVTVAVAVPLAHRVIFIESTLDPTTPIPDSFLPFKGVRGAVYASDPPDPANLVFTDEAHPALTGHNVLTSRFLVGDDYWSVVYRPRGELIPAWTVKLPWLILSVGMALALLIAAMVEALTRRQSYANDLVTQRTRSLADANAELSETRAFINHMVSTGPLVMMVVNADDLGASYVSPNIERLFGITESQALAAGFLVRHVDPHQVRAFGTLMGRIADADDDARETVEFRMRAGDGHYRWVEAVVVPARADRLEQRSVFIYALDIDARHHAEAAQEAAQAAADAANRSKSEFLSRMSHELRTPLNAILGYAQILEMEELRDDQVQPVEQIMSSGRHLLDLINEVLDISRIEVGRLSMSVEPVAVSDVLDTALDMVRPAAADAQLDIVVDRGPDPSVLADRQRLRQILLNLLSNSVKYNRRGGRVTISCQVYDGSTARISVTDTGHGISRDEFDLVFAPFERLGAQQTEVEGTGIGLALSKHLAEAMGGSMGLDSEVGAGSTFWVDLPLAHAPVAPVADDEPVAPALANEDRATITVLQIEDNPANVRLVERALDRVIGARLVTAVNGREGLETAAELEPDVILLDLHLPDMTGEQVLRLLSDDPRTAAIPVIVVSADATPGQVERLLASGATDYLTKPIDVRRFLDVVLAAGAPR